MTQDKVNDTGFVVSILKPKFEVYEWRDSIEEVLSELLTLFLLQDWDFEVLMGEHNKSLRKCMKNEYAISLLNTYKTLYKYRSYLPKMKHIDRMKFLVIAKKYGDIQ